ncbi:hypothetical protein LCGC14_1044740 [marine sediment metagenome]|uniref:Uncharacterized protein n=2 Tax=marine sediment metagenome TaxID=412755 RepID=A0A0F9MV31_9ZZZZ
MGFFDFIKEGVSNHFEKRKQDQELVDRIRKETAVQERQIFEEQMRKDALEVAKAKAKKEAAELSGLKKMRAENRLRNLNNPQSREGFLGKMREYTQRNIARREENLRRTAEIKASLPTGNQQVPVAGQKPFSTSLNQRRWS